MPLKNQVEWALHCCVLLACLLPNRYLSTKDLAEFHGVPIDYLSKVLQNLSQASLISGTQDRYRLAKPPETISVLEIVEAIEGKKNTLICCETRHNTPCRYSDAKDFKLSGFARIMREADEAWRNSLRNVFLSDILCGMQNELPTDLLEKNAAWLNIRF